MPVFTDMTPGGDRHYLQQNIFPHVLPGASRNPSRNHPNHLNHRNHSSRLFQIDQVNQWSLLSTLGNPCFLRRLEWTYRGQVCMEWFYSVGQFLRRLFLVLAIRIASLSSHGTFPPINWLHPVDNIDTSSSTLYKFAWDGLLFVLVVIWVGIASSEYLLISGKYWDVNYWFLKFTFLQRICYIDRTVDRTEFEREALRKFLFCSCTIWPSVYWNGFSKKTASIAWSFLQFQSHNWISFLNLVPIPPLTSSIAHIEVSNRIYLVLKRKYLAMNR